MIAIPATAILMRVKGGLLGKLPVSGKEISAVGFSLLCLFITDSYLGLLGGLGWWIGNKPSVGEIIGAIGGFKGNWCEEGWNRKRGWSEGIQRGIFTGACISVFLWNPAFIIAGSLFPVCSWLGVSINQLITKKIKASWWIFELLWGACLGIALAATGLKAGWPLTEIPFFQIKYPY